MTAPARSAVVEDWTIKDCLSCGGSPIFQVSDKKKIHTFTLEIGDRVVLKQGDILFVYCSECNQEIKF